MKKIFAIVTLMFVGWTAKAQSSNGNNNISDSTHHHRQWHSRGAGGGNDSLHHKKFDDSKGGPGMAMGHFGHRREVNRFHSHGEKRWSARMHFSPEQRKQMQAANIDYRKKSADLYKNDDLTLREYKSQLLTLQKEKKEKMQSLLTPEQKNSIAAFKKHADENAQVRAAASLERMKIRLKLSDEQAATIKMKQQAMRADIHAIRDNDNLMRDQKMEQIMSIAKKNKEDIKTVLTPEQLSIFEDMHKRKWERS